jgi:hypothetical protein
MLSRGDSSDEILWLHGLFKIKILKHVKRGQKIKSWGLTFLGLNLAKMGFKNEAPAPGFHPGAPNGDFQRKSGPGWLSLWKLNLYHWNPNWCKTFFLSKDLMVGLSPWHSLNWCLQTWIPGELWSSVVRVKVQQSVRGSGQWLPQKLAGNIWEWVWKGMMYRVWSSYIIWFDFGISWMLPTK